jgi:hypothetical protein
MGPVFENVDTITSPGLLVLANVEKPAAKPRPDVVTPTAWMTAASY